MVCHHKQSMRTLQTAKGILETLCKKVEETRPPCAPHHQFIQPRIQLWFFLESLVFKALQMDENLQTYKIHYLIEIVYPNVSTNLEGNINIDHSTTPSQYFIQKFPHRQECNQHDGYICNQHNRHRCTSCQSLNEILFLSKTKWILTDCCGMSSACRLQLK